MCACVAIESRLVVSAASVAAPQLVCLFRRLAPERLPIRVASSCVAGLLLRSASWLASPQWVPRVTTSETVSTTRERGAIPLPLARPEVEAADIVGVRDAMKIACMQGDTRTPAV